MRRMLRPYHLWMISSLLLFSLTGCGQSSGAERFWQDYHQQLSDALNAADIDRSPPPNIGAFPERQSMLFAISETRASLLNVYALRECDITSLVAARNNQLGRVAPPSQQWLYERELWQRISHCWNTDAPNELSDENRERLREITLTKTKQLPYVSWNAIFDSSEWEKNFSRASQPLSATELSQSSEKSDIKAGVDALLYLRDMTLHQFDRKWKQNSSQLENHLKALQERPLTAELLRSLMLATQRLDEATALLNSTEPSRCLPPWEHIYLDQLVESAHTWLSEIATLIDSHPVTPPAKWQHYYSAWLSLEAPDAPWKNFQRALINHMAARREFPPCQASAPD